MRRCGADGRRITCEFGEAIAILAAFGLLNLAFGTLARAYEPPVVGAADRRSLADAVGPDGLIGGQAADLLATDQQISFETLERIHRGKTGALFVAAATAGAIAAGAAADVDRDRCRPTRRISASRSRSSTTCSTSRAIRRETGKAVREDAQEDHVRLVQRRRRRAAARGRAVPDRRSRARAVRPTRRSPARAVRLRRGAKLVTSGTWQSRRQASRVDDLRQQLRALGYLDAGVDRFVLGPRRTAAAAAHRAAGRVARRRARGVLLGPAAAVGLTRASARTGHRPARRHRFGALPRAVVRCCRGHGLACHDPGGRDGCQRWPRDAARGRSPEYAGAAIAAACLSTSHSGGAARTPAWDGARRSGPRSRWRSRSPSASCSVMSPLPPHLQSPLLVTGMTGRGTQDRCSLNRHGPSGCRRLLRPRSRSQEPRRSSSSRRRTRGTRPSLSRLPSSRVVCA